MAVFEQDLSIPLDERRVFVSAMAKYVRYEEAVHHTSEAVSLYYHGAIRREALAIAALEGVVTRQELLARIIGDRQATNLGRGARLAADLYDAIHLAWKWGANGPDSSMVYDLFMVADSSSGRLMRPDTKWSLEEDSAWLADRLSLLTETTDPWTAIEIFREIWISGRFFGTSRRMAALSAIWLIPKGFECDIPAFGLADQLSRHADHFRNAAADKEGWSNLFAYAVSEASKSEKKALHNALSLHSTLLALCPQGRASSSIDKAIHFAFRQPFFSAKQFADNLELTSRGAKVVLDKMVEANVLEVDDISRNRKYICRRILV